MRANNRIPRIIRILKIKEHKIYCAFNNGEYRIIDFNSLFEKWKTTSKSFEYPITKSTEFRKVKLNSGTLSWPHITKKIKLPDGKIFETFLDFDTIVLFENSIKDEKKNQRYQIGQTLKSERIKAGLTQEELAKRSGTTKNYISRIENNKSDIELRTLRKIIEIGMSKKLEIGII